MQICWTDLALIILICWAFLQCIAQEDWVKKVLTFVVGGWSRKTYIEVIKNDLRSLIANRRELYGERSFIDKDRRTWVSLRGRLDGHTSKITTICLCLQSTMMSNNGFLTWAYVRSHTVMAIMKCHWPLQSPAALLSQSKHLHMEMCRKAKLQWQCQWQFSIQKTLEWRNLK